MRRRRFLGLSVASVGSLSGVFSGVLSGGLGQAAAAATGPIMVSVILTDISATTPLAPLLRSVEAFRDSGVGVTCGLVLPDDKMMERRFVQTGLALKALGVEFALHLPDFGAQSPYFQSRAAFEGQSRLTRLLADEGEVLPLTTILCEEVAPVMEPTGARASGFRNVLVRPKVSDFVRSETWPNGVVRFYGGEIIRFGEAVAIALDRERENQHFYYLSAATLDGAGYGFADWQAAFID